MKIGFIGLGKMGQGIVESFIEKGVNVVGFNRTKEVTQEFSEKLKSKSEKLNQKNKNGNFTPSYSLDEFVEILQSPRIIWIMVSHGVPVDQVIDGLRPFLDKGDILIDAGNSFYKNSQRRYKELKKYGIHFLDIGTSGGLEGARNGVCLMVGGDTESFRKVEPLLKIIAVKDGYSYFVPSGAGHFVKMVHNGVEYGMLQSLGEGFAILEKSKEYNLDLHKVSQNWVHGSVVRGWLVELLEKAFKKDARLSSISGVVGGGSTGEWTVSIAKELGVDIPIIEGSLKERQKTRTKPTFAGKIVAALRKEFGGHEVMKSDNGK